MTDGRLRVCIENIQPEIEGGRYPIKRVVGEEVRVGADIIADGHEVLSARVLYRREREKKWREKGCGFENTDELLNVPGIGPKRFEAIRDLVAP